MKNAEVFVSKHEMAENDSLFFSSFVQKTYILFPTVFFENKTAED